MVREAQLGGHSGMEDWSYLLFIDKVNDVNLLCKREEF